MLLNSRAFVRHRCSLCIYRKSRGLNASSCVGGRVVLRSNDGGSSAAALTSSTGEVGSVFTNIDVASRRQSEVRCEMSDALNFFREGDSGPTFGARDTGSPRLTTLRVRLRYATPDAVHRTQPPTEVARADSVDRTSGSGGARSTDLGFAERMRRALSNLFHIRYNVGYL